MPKKPDERQSTVPTSFPDVPPPRYTSPADYSSLEVMMAMQATMGKLTEAVDSLKEQAKENRSKLDRLSHIIYATGVVGTILLGTGIWFLNKIADVVLAHFAVAPK